MSEKLVTDKAFISKLCQAIEKKSRTQDDFTTRF